MGTLHRDAGFTIIETMLFLAISGLLIVTLLAGTGASINIQRYRDSVQTFKNYLQNQYADVASVSNDRDNNWACDTNAFTEVTAGVGEVRGQSKCVIIGKYVTVVGSKTTEYSVTAFSPTTTATGGDIDKLKTQYVLNVAASSKEESTLEWGTSLAWPAQDSKAGSERSVAILIIRSPDSGLLYTFTSNTVPENPSPDTLKTLLVTGASTPGQGAQTLCLDSTGLFTGENLSVYIAPFATGPSAIENRSNDLEGNTVKC